MNLLDENIPAEQRDILLSHGVRCRMIGGEVAWLSISDDSIIALLHALSQPTFFTRDRDFFKRKLRHNNYTLVWLDARPEEAAMLFNAFCGTLGSGPMPAGWVPFFESIMTAFNTGAEVVKRFSGCDGRKRVGEFHWRPPRVDSHQ